MPGKHGKRQRKKANRSKVEAGRELDTKAVRAREQLSALRSGLCMAIVPRMPHVTLPAPTLWLHAHLYLLLYGEECDILQVWVAKQIHCMCAGL